MKMPNAVRNVRTISALLDAAEQEARASGEDLAGAEHLLLVALTLEEDSARSAFARVGADPGDLRGDRRPARRRVAGDRHRVRRWRPRGGAAAGTEHGTAARALRAMGVDREALRVAADEVLEEG